MHRFECENGTGCVLKFSGLLLDVVQRNLDAIYDYTQRRKAFEYPADISISKAPLVEETDESPEFSLVLSTDGVILSKSTTQNDGWPIWLGVAQLPPILKFAAANITLAGLFVGPCKPPWEKIVPLLSAELQKTQSILFGTRSISVKFKVVILVCDLVAKANVLNMYQHNGWYGCNYCTAYGVTLDKKHCYYPYKQSFEIRSQEFHSKTVAIAEALNSESDRITNVSGGKGASAFDRIVDGLPLSAGIDYMHCVLIGVYQEILKLQIKKMVPRDRSTFDYEIAQIRAPQEVIEHGRSFRGLKHEPNFKANEYFNYMFFV